MHGFDKTLDLIWRTYSGEAAWQTVADLSRFHRIQASPGYRGAAQMVHQYLTSAGVEVETLSFPATEQTRFWARPSFQEWDCREATLRLVAPEDESSLLADFRANPISLIQRSLPFDGEVEVVVVEDGAKDADYQDLQVTGKVVLTKGDPQRVWNLAVHQRGAVGILFDGMRTVSPVRPEGDLANVRQYTSFWWKPGDTKCFGFVLTPSQGLTLRRLLKEPGSPVRVHARVDSRLYDGALEVVQATIAGTGAQEILVTAHLCHPQPSANDNASGAAAALEAARTLQTLIDRGKLPRPRRTIRFLWMPEMTGTYAYLADREQELDQLVAGINLDMVGEDQNQTGSVWLIENPPDAIASFAPDLLACLRDRLPELKSMSDVTPSHTGMGTIPLYRQAETPFSGGSDHYILSDPAVGVPTPMLIQWPDRFYHTAADTPDRTDPHSLARAGSLAAAYAYWLSTAGALEATWLGYEMVARFKTRLVHLAHETVTEALVIDDVEALARTLAGLDRHLAYHLDRHRAALDTLDWIAPMECPVHDLQTAAAQAANRELAWAKGTIELRAAALDATLPGAPPSPDLSQHEQQASDLIPARQVRGPVPLQSYLHQLDAPDRDAWHQLLQDRNDRSHHTLVELATFWADGSRSILEVADLVEIETGHRDVELLLTYFRLLEKLGFVQFV
jgi:aminopeptidase YwaD